MLKGSEIKYKARISDLETELESLLKRGNKVYSN